ncbi:MAG: hypothetical protein K0R65_118 [Crocinitomicaceae bacterium]|jgi:predicted glycoside hydrolase/deacetylase ChbG (UPF0249 family)|nr:hypothetical protein [Crocinitomicaceae bacterium]
MGKLILTADDYGLSTGVNEAILQSVRNNTITSVQVLMNYVGENEVLKLAKTIAESGNRCGIGVHLCTTAGKSVIQEPSSLTYIGTDGAYHFRELQDWDYDETLLEDMKKELEAQYKKLSDIIGGERIDSLSSHHNIHLFDEKYMKIVADIAKAHAIPVRSPLRWNQDDTCLRRNYPDGLALSPIEHSSILTLAQCRKGSTRRVLLNALDSKRMLVNRELVNNNNPGKRGAPNSTSGHWYGQPKKRALNWTLEQLLLLKPVHPQYATEIFMHLSNTAAGGDPKLTYPMSKRLEEYTALNSVDVKDLLKSLYNHADYELGSYRKVLLGESVDYTI